MSSPENRKTTSKYNIGLIALIVVLLSMAVFVVMKKRAASAANAAVNYDDPNMQKANEFVNEATASCLQKEVDASSDLPSCINNYKGGPTPDAKAKTSTVDKSTADSVPTTVDDIIPGIVPDSEPVDLPTSPAQTPSAN